MDAHATRPAAVAGMFYPGDPGNLSREVRALLDTAVLPAPTFAPPKAIIVPHAGYVYSGITAARAYALLAPCAATLRRVVMFGPSHRVAVRGLALPHARQFATPLGMVALDSDAMTRALTLPQVIHHDAAHAQEHALEVQLPFLQQILPDFRLVPFAVGYATADEVAEVLDLLWGGPETLIVISSDLSHYHAYADAQRRDRLSVDAILHLRLLLDHDQACGATPINGLIETALRRGLQPHLLDLCNSGDTAGDKSRVVGYASIAFTEAEPGHA